MPNHLLKNLHKKKQNGELNQWSRKKGHLIVNYSVVLLVEFPETLFDLSWHMLLSYNNNL